MLAGSIERPVGRLHYEVSGRNHAPTLVLLHPLGASLGVWDPQMPQFEQFFRVLRFDTCGHGKSTLTGSGQIEFTLGDLAADVIEILDALHIEGALVRHVARRRRRVAGSDQLPRSGATVGAREHCRAFSDPFDVG